MTAKQIKTMSAAKVAKALEEYNKWWNAQNWDDNDPPYEPYEVSALVDKAIELLKEVK